MAGKKHIRAVGQQPETKAQLNDEFTGDVDTGGADTGGDDIGGADLGVDLSDAIEPADELELADYDLDEEALILDHAGRFAWLAPTVAVLVIAAWTGFYGWAMQGQLIAALSAPGDWARLIIDWSVPVLLVGVSWLLAMRHSRAEAGRFADSAALLSRESRELENRLTVVNRELSLAREFLAAQSLELESLGRIASERIATHADTLQGLIKNNGAQIDAIGSASESALTNMTKLRDNLPVVANSARDMSNQLGAAGRTAQSQLDKMVEGFDRLNQFGKASEAQVLSLDGRVTETLGRFDGQLAKIEETAGARLDEIQSQTENYRSEVELAEAAALDALTARVTNLQTEAANVSAQLREAEEQGIRQFTASKDRFSGEIKKAIEKIDEIDAKAIGLAQTRVDELNAKVSLFVEQLETRDRQFNEQVSRVQETFSTNEAQASEVLAQRLADLDDALALRREAQSAETEKLVAHSTAMNTQIEELSALITAVSTHGEETRNSISTGLLSLENQLEEKRERLRDTQTQIDKLTESSVRMLEIIQSGAKFSRDDLPESMERALTTLGDVESRAAEVSTLMLATNTKAERLSDYLIEARGKVDENDESIDALHAKATQQFEETLLQLRGLQSGLSSLSQQTETLSTKTSDDLQTGIIKLEEATKSVFETLNAGVRDKIDALAVSLSERAVNELERSMRNGSAEAVGKLEQAAAHASGVGREATIQLRDQLAKVNELTVNLEQRIARGRELAEEQVNNDFARRMALITDSLNSSAIDLTSALSLEVSDTSWDAYLKGDRGIFTRRAVRLIDSGESREISELYQNDDEFRENVSRYIHDFEAMLRSVLSTRNGKALGVTVLGSDVGKLYVVLAQSIERLRQ